MSQCLVIPTVAPSRGQRLLEAVVRWLSHSTASRELIDQAWIDSGFGRAGALSRRMLEDVGVAPDPQAQAERERAWQLMAALDATRHL